LITHAQHFPLFSQAIFGQAHSGTLGQFICEISFQFYQQHEPDIGAPSLLSGVHPLLSGAHPPNTPKCAERSPTTLNALPYRVFKSMDAVFPQTSMGLPVKNR